jgi:tRNA threonylcarbamoyladenosine modification (KEOPS) complex  Pcc1 subunit
LKKQRVNIRIRLELDNLTSLLSNKCVNTIINALEPETKFLTSSEEIRITSNDGVICININTEDLESMRAIVNTYIRLLSLSYMSLNL